MLNNKEKGLVLLNALVSGLINQSRNNTSMVFVAPCNKYVQDTSVLICVLLKSTDSAERAVLELTLDSSQLEIFKIIKEDFKDILTPLI